MSNQKAKDSTPTTFARIRPKVRLPFQVTVELDTPAGKERVNVNVTEHNMPLLLPVKLILMKNLPHIFREDDEDWASVPPAAEEPASPPPPASKPEGRQKSKQANEPDKPDLSPAETA